MSPPSSIRRRRSTNNCDQRFPPASIGSRRRPRARGAEESANHLRAPAGTAGGGSCRVVSVLLVSQRFVARSFAWRRLTALRPGPILLSSRWCSRSTSSASRFPHAERVADRRPRVLDRTHPRRSCGANVDRTTQSRRRSGLTGTAGSQRRSVPRGERSPAAAVGDSAFGRDRQFCCVCGREDR